MIQRASGHTRLFVFKKERPEGNTIGPSGGRIIGLVDAQQPLTVVEKVLMRRVNKKQVELFLAFLMLNKKTV